MSAAIEDYRLMAETALAQCFKDGLKLEHCRLFEAMRNYGPLCVGLDPHPGILQAWGLPDTPAGVSTFSSIPIEALAGRVAAIKPQVAFYERHGLTLSTQEYYLPPLQKGMPVQPYRLMTCGCQADEALVHRLYREVYDSGRTLADYRRQFVEKNGVCAYTR